MITPINPIGEKPKSSKLMTALKFAGILGDLWNSAASIYKALPSQSGGQSLNSGLPSQLNLNAGLPSQSLGQASIGNPSLFSPQERTLNYMRLYGLK